MLYRIASRRGIRIGTSKARRNGRNNYQTDVEKRADSEAGADWEAASLKAWAGLELSVTGTHKTCIRDDNRTSRARLHGPYG